MGSLGHAYSVLGLSPSASKDQVRWSSIVPSSQFARRKGQLRRMINAAKSPCYLNPRCLPSCELCCPAPGSSCRLCMGVHAVFCMGGNCRHVTAPRMTRPVQRHAL